ncbi:hypothetical protein ScPMuIL_003550 [Solemya velum]
MEKYENMGLVGEGSYGMVLKCKHKETGQLVAIKKFLESEDDKMVKKIALREVKMLKSLRHDHLVNLIEVFRRKKRLYLVFEFVDHTVLDELEKCPNGLDENTVRKISWQVLKGIEFCHLHNIIHRDIKPENILVSKASVVKLCDFGFARTLAQPGESYTDYVATRWYRAPELLVGDTKYGKAVDIWAVGCLLSEMLTGEPLFPGDSDIDQLYHIVKVFGNLTPRHREVFLRNPLFVGMRLPEVREVIPLEKKFNKISAQLLNLMKLCLRLDPDDRPTCSELVKHEFFVKDGFVSKFAHDIKAKIHRDQQGNPLLKSLSKDKQDAGKESPEALNKNAATKKKKRDNKETSKDQANEDKVKRKHQETDKTLKKASVPNSNVTSHPSNSKVSVTSKTPENKVEKEKTKEKNETNKEKLKESKEKKEKERQKTDDKEISDKTEKNDKISSKDKDNSKDNKEADKDKENSSSVRESTIPPIHQTAQSLHTPSIQSFTSPNPSRTSPGVSSHPLLAGSPPPPTHSPSPIRIGDKVMKKTVGNYKKLGTTPNHHSITISPQPLQSERSSLHDKTLENMKYKTKKEQERRDTISFPEVKGAEALPKVKQNMQKVVAQRPSLATIPHIANIDPFSGSQTESQSLPENGKESNLPMV